MPEPEFRPARVRFEGRSYALDLDERQAFRGVEVVRAEEVDPASGDDVPPEVYRTALRLAAGFDPWAPEGPQNATEWDLCAAAWREVARRRLGEVGRLREEFEVLRDACGHCLAAGRPPNQQMIDNADHALHA